MKNLLCGRLAEPVEGLEEGDSVKVMADEKVENLESGVIGYAYQSRQYEGSYGVNPLYVSPGNRVSDEKAVELVERFCFGYKLPEPIRVADKKVDRFKQELE